MALKILMLRKNLSDKQKELDALRAKQADFDTREKELESDIIAAETKEEKAVVEEAVEAFEQEKADHAVAVEALEIEVGKLEKELTDIEDQTEKETAATVKDEAAERKDNFVMDKRTKFFGMNVRERDDFLSREDVKDFLSRLRSFKNQTRAVTGADVMIPTVILDLIKENVLEYSKLYKHVNVRYVPGQARQPIMGVIPEAVWTEACASLNELTFTFGAVTVNGYKVGGFIPVCNALLEDADPVLAEAVISGIGQSIGLALDKAILYGTGTNMPMGIVTRLVQSADPGNAPAGSPAWVDLHESNVLAITGKTDAALFKALVEATGAAKGDYSRGSKFWAMSEATYTKLIANALSINAAGAVSAGIDGVMPVIGGVIEVLDFIPNDVIVGGYGDLYLLAERAGIRLEQSAHVQFIEDNTVFKGTARYDGAPIVPAGFVAIGIGGTAPTATPATPFAPAD